MSELFLESLEQRIAPATLINPKTVEYQDIDGDLVQIKISKGAFSESMFAFEAGGGSSEILQGLDLTSSQFAGASLTITAKQAGGGDGLVDIGAILAAGNDLGKVTVDGGLAKITAGDNLTSAKGLAGLTVNSLGMRDSADFGLPDSISMIQGKLGALVVKGSMGGVLLNTGDAKSGIAKITIGGSLVGGAGSLAGWISSTADIGTVKIGQNMDGHAADGINEAGIFSGAGIKSVEVGGSVIAGGFANNGSIFATKDIVKVHIGQNLGQGDVGAGDRSGAVISDTGKIGSVLIGGSLLGGDGQFSGSIGAGSDIGKVQVVGNVEGGSGGASGVINGLNSGTISIKGDLLGGGGLQSGSVSVAGGSLTKLTIGGEVKGNTGEKSGTILAEAGKLGTISIGEDVAGGTGLLSGTIFGLKGIASVTVSGNLLGGTGDDSGTIQAGPAQGFGAMDNPIQGNIGKVFIGGDAHGNDGLRSGAVLAWNSSLGTAFIGGSVIGGEGQFSALIYGMNNFTKAQVVGSVLGGDGPYSGRIATDTGPLGTVIIGGELKGGSAANSATIYAGTTIGSVSIAGDVTGGSGVSSGSISAKGNIGLVAIGDKNHVSDLIGGIDNSAEVSSQTGLDAGAIKSLQGSVRNVIITGNIEGRTAERGASINAFNGALGTITVNGSVVGAEGFLTGSIWGETQIANVKIGGSVTGGDANLTGLILTNGSANNIAIGGSLVGSDYTNTGSIRAFMGVNTVVIGGDLKGGSNSQGDTFYTGAIIAGGLQTVEGQTSIVWGKINSLEIKGSIISGHLSDDPADAENALINSGAVRVTGGIGKLTVGHSLVGNEDVQVLITSFANPYLTENSFFKNNSTIGSITIKENVSHALIGAGIIDTGNDPLFGGFPYAGIGTVTVGGDWTASSITAGANPGPNGYGLLDTPMGSVFAGPAGNFSKIGKIVIGGPVNGGAEGEQYGFVAGNFGSIVIHGQTQTLPSAGATANVTENGSVKIHTVPYTPPPTT